MSICQRLLGLLVLAISSVAFAQITPTKPPDVGSSEVTNSQLPATTPLDPCRSAGKGSEQAAILSETMGVDFGPYLTRIMQIVKQNWYTLMPQLVYPPVSKQGKVVIEFFIRKDGTVDIDGITMQASSGDTVLDRAARGSIIRSDPLPLLPREFPGRTFRLRFSFYYNLSPDISISPCVDVRVPVGSTLQFAASGKGITDTSVTWSVSGPGCSKSGCGAISDGGLYTAPVDIPNPPTVIVEAASRTDSGTRGKSKLTVVQANPTH